MSEKLKLETLLEKQKELEARKSELEADKAKGGAFFTEEKEKELEDIVLDMLDVEDELAEEREALVKAKAALASSSKSKPDEFANYEPVPGTEKLVHALIHRGKRFNAETGEELARPYVQMFTYGEWQAFTNHNKALGYTVDKILYKPF